MTKATYHGHDQVGAQMTKDILTRMKFPNDVVDVVSDVVKNHMKIKDMNKCKRQSSLRRFFGKKHIDLIVQIADADNKGCEHDKPEGRFDVWELVEKVHAQFDVILPAPIITGEDLIAAGEKPGPAFRDALFHTHNQQLNGCDDKDKLLRSALGFVKQYGKK